MIWQDLYIIKFSPGQSAPTKRQRRLAALSADKVRERNERDKGVKLKLVRRVWEHFGGGAAMTSIYALDDGAQP